MYKETVLEILSHLGLAAVTVLNSSYLKDTDNSLYYKVKDAAIVLMNCKESELLIERA